jgi:hypothetical protein
VTVGDPPIPSMPALVLRSLHMRTETRWFALLLCVSALSLCAQDKGVVVDGWKFELGMPLEAVLSIAPDDSRVSNKCELHSDREEQPGRTQLELTACINGETKTPAELAYLWFEKGRLTGIRKTWGIYYHDVDSLTAVDDLVAALDFVTGGRTATMAASVETHRDDQGRWANIVLTAAPYKLTLTRLSSPRGLAEGATLYLELGASK